MQTNLLSSGIVSLSWSPVDGASTYQILRGPTPEVGSATLVASNLTSLTFADGQPPFAVDLHYWVRAAGPEQLGQVSEPVLARQDILLWTWTSTGSLTTPVLLTNGSVIVGVNRSGLFDRPPNLGHLYALAPDGSVAWEYDPGATVLAQPVVNPLGHLVAGVGRGNTNHSLVTLSNQGTLISDTTGGPTGGFLAVGPDGTVILLGRGVAGQSPQIQAYAPSGDLLWADGIANGSTVPRFGVHPDGSVLAGTTTSLTCYELSGQRRWSRGGPTLAWGEPALAEADRVIALNSRQELIAFRLDGTALWTNRLANIAGTPAGAAVSASGITYVTDSGSVLHAIDTDGVELWKLPMAQPTPHAPSLDQAGRILVASSSVIAMVDNTGTLSRLITLPETASQAPVLTSDGTLLVVIKGQLRVYRLADGLSAEAPWPMARHDVRGSSAAAFAPINPVQISVRLNGTEATLRILAPPPTVQVFRSTNLLDWNLEAELTSTGAPIDWVVPNQGPQPAFFRARAP